jgi:hypothetical protein
MLIEILTQAIDQFKPAMDLAAGRIRSQASKAWILL